ncbi:MAG: LD-carboxypeptidase [Polyangiales bacterium]
MAGNLRQSPRRHKPRAAQDAVAARGVRPAPSRARVRWAPSVYKRRAMPNAPLRPGDRVAVVSPSSPSDPAQLTEGIARWAACCSISNDPRPFSRKGFLAGDDSLRGGALVEAVRDHTVRAVLAARGGYGAARVLEGHGEALREALRDDPKPLVGFSDITALHALWSLAGARSVHGPMVAAVGRGASLEEVRAVLCGAVPEAWTGLEVWRGGEARGVARGGNLAVLASLLGTPWAMDLDGAVLLLEDVSEAPYRLDRMLTSLRLSGALRGVRAVVLGEFTGCDARADGVSADEVLRERLGDLGVPVLARAPFGHGATHRAWVQGAPVRVTADGALVHDEGVSSAR